jgi:hypothetical protein
MQFVTLDTNDRLCLRSTTTTNNSSNSSSSSSSSSAQSSEQSYKMLGACLTAASDAPTGVCIELQQTEVAQAQQEKLQAVLELPADGCAALLAGILAIIDAAKAE